MENAPQSEAKAQAAHRMAISAAEGTGVPQDWNAALDLLQRAAELGLALAQAELAALAGDWAQSHDIVAGKTLPSTAWADYRRAVDIPRLLATPRPRILSASPRIATVEGFASRELCDWLIARARPKLEPAKVYDRDTGGARSEAVRTNSECHFSGEENDLLLLILRARMANVTELPIGAMEATAILHYTVGQQFLPHFDFLDTGLPAIARQVAERGQRVLTFLICLNDDYEGGETEFPALGKRWKGHSGNALYFWNVEPNGAPDKRTAHAGLPPTRGEKWLLSQWIRSRVL